MNSPIDKVKTIKEPAKIPGLELGSTIVKNLVQNEAPKLAAPSSSSLKFVEDYVDRDKLYEGQLQKKIDMFYGALRWDKPTDSEQTIERFF